jgi:hypothetical protein
MRDVSKLIDQVINVDNGGGSSPIPGAAWVKDLGLSPSEISQWLADSVTDPSSVDSVYAGMGDTGDWYIVLLNE